MVQERSAQQLELLRKARQLARAAGKSWADLSKEERQAFKKQARGKSPSPAASPIRDRARKAAAAAGKSWQQLSQEERKTFLDQARQRP